MASLACLDRTTAARERAQLRELKRKRHTYQDVLACLQWLERNGTHPDRHRCLFPISWLAQGRVEMILGVLERERIRAAADERRRELLGVRDRERRLADLGQRRAVERFRREYPTEPDQRRAMLCIFNRREDLFAGMDLADPLAQRACIALAVQDLEDAEAIRGNPQPLENRAA